MRGNMEIKEAIRRIKDHFSVHDDGRPTPYLDEAVSIAIKALEKRADKSALNELIASAEALDIISEVEIALIR